MIDQSRHGFVFGLAGYSGAGKTSLAEKIISVLVARGHNVASIKHAHHHFDPDTPGKDSWRHRKAGASQMLISSALRRVKFTETPDKNEAGLPALLEELSPLILCWSKGSRRSTSPRSKSGGRKQGALFFIPNFRGSGWLPVIRRSPTAPCPCLISTMPRPLPAPSREGSKHERSR